MKLTANKLIGSAEEVKQQVSLPDFMHSRGLGEHARKSATCLFHEDRHASFSVYQAGDGSWRWKCFAGCGGGDVIDLVCKLDGISFKEAIRKLGANSNVTGARGKSSIVTSVTSFSGEGMPLPAFNWRSCVEALANGDDGATTDRLARQRHYRLETLWMLLKDALIGLYNRNPAFPVRHHQHRSVVVGCHYVTPDKDWFYTPGCRATPLLLGNGQSFHATESTWDAISLIDRFPYEAVTIICSRGAANAGQIAAHVPAGQLVRLWPQNDAAGEAWCLKAQQLLRRTAVCRTPQQFKDVNEWFASL